MEKKEFDKIICDVAKDYFKTDVWDNAEGTILAYGEIRDVVDQCVHYETQSLCEQVEILRTDLSLNHSVRDENIKRFTEIIDNLREQLKEKEEEIKNLVQDNVHLTNRIKNHYTPKVESQSTLIESLAGALVLAKKRLNQEEINLLNIDEALLQYDNFKKKENGN